MSLDVGRCTCPGHSAGCTTLVDRSRFPRCARCRKVCPVEIYTKPARPAGPATNAKEEAWP